MTEMSDCHAAMHDDIELALLAAPTSAGWVYVDFGGANPRIIAHTEDKATYVAYTERLLAILRALHGDLHEGVKSQHNTADFSDEQRAAARPALAARLADAGCSDDEIEQLIRRDD